jgi:hypothetical protein
MRLAYIIHCVLGGIGCREPEQVEASQLVERMNIALQDERDQQALFELLQRGWIFEILVHGTGYAIV